MYRDLRLISAVHAMTAVLCSNPSVDSSMESILRVCVEAADATGGTIYLHDPQRRVLVFRHVFPEEMTEHLRGQAFADDRGIAGAVFTNRRSRIDNDVESAGEHDAEFDIETHFVTRCMISVPLLMSADEPVGVVQLLNKRDCDFSESDLLVLEIVGNIAGMAIRNAQLADETRRATALSAMGDIAHDIKNKVAPLTMGAMTLMIDLESLQQALHDNDAKSGLQTLASLQESAEIIASSAQRTHRYTQLIADLSKGKEMAISKQDADLSAVATREFLSHQSAARLRGIELVAKVPCEVIASFDEVMLERAIYNLTINAVEATPEGGLVTLELQPGPEEIVLSIADTGHGMPLDRLAQVLAGTAESSKAGGTGLGTSIVRKIAEMHSGRLEVSSTPGAGTTFRLVLPRA